MRVPTKYKPATGFSPFFHTLLLTLLPALIYVLIRINIVPLAFALIFIGKWRMFAVRPRYWWANIRANAVDLMVSLSLVIFMAHTGSALWQLVWGVLFALWLIYLKPGSSTLKVSIQAFVGQTLALVSLFIAWPSAPLFGLVLAVWTICFLSAKHFLTSFEEPHGSLYANYWAYFAASLMWVTGHWLRFYPDAQNGPLSMPSLLLSVLGFGLGSLYYLDETDQLTVIVRREVIFMMIAIVSVVLVLAGWGDLSI
jgi:hypothetical protein